MPWVRRASTAFCTVVTAMFVYGAYAGVILYKLSTLIGCRLGTGPPARNGPIGVTVLGVFVPVWVILLLWLLLPGTFLAFEAFYALRRRYRDKHDCCIECGQSLQTFRGHCPRCGTRIGPGLPTRRYVLNMPRDV
jgi:hypothetical protein